METTTLQQYHGFELDSSTTPSPPRCRRKRTSHESVSEEPGSARAIYLMKNRNAASKCRNKQKKEQTDLIEAAREAERTNKILKAKVAILNEGLRELMTVVGQHGNCPDYRLNVYAGRIMQRDAGGLEMGHAEGLEEGHVEGLEEATMNFDAGVQEASFEYGMDAMLPFPYLDFTQIDDNWSPVPQ